MVRVPCFKCTPESWIRQVYFYLCKLALKWMLCEARKAGLLIDDQTAQDILGRTPGSPFTHGSPEAKAHESLTGWWPLAEFIPKRHYNWRNGTEERRMNLFRRRTIPEGSLVHDSVVERLKLVPAYRPSNLPKDYQVERNQTDCPWTPLFRSSEER